MVTQSSNTKCQHIVSKGALRTAQSIGIWWHIERLGEGRAEQVWERCRVDSMEDLREQARCGRSVSGCKAAGIGSVGDLGRL